MKVSFYARLRPIVGQKSVDIPLPEGATAEQLVDEIVQRWPALREYMLDDAGALAANVQLCSSPPTRWTSSPPSPGD